MASKELVAQLRDALAHLYDPAHLQSHPLADALIDGETLGEMTRAQTLRRLLLDTLEQLSPPDGGGSSAEDSACYQALHYRYLDGLSVEEIGEILAMSPRQIYRKLREGVEALASLLTDHLDLNSGETQLDQSAAHSPSPPADEERARPDRRTLAQAALQQLGSHAQSAVIEINLILETIVRDLRPYCRQIGAEIELTLPQEPVYVYADRAMLRQALLNLLTNGLDQIRGALRIDVVQTACAVRLTFTVQATDEEQQTLAQHHRLTKREGIGLEVALQLLQMQNIAVHHSTETGLWQVEIQMPQTRPHQILVIDDMPDIPPLFQRFTSLYAIDVISATGGDEALALLQGMTPSLILLDVMLPRRDGWEILQTLKADPVTAQIPVIICSILNEPGLAHALGADSYLPKPVSQEALLGVLARFLQPTLEPVAM